MEWWSSALGQLNDLLLHAPWLKDWCDLPPTGVEKGWLGYPGASVTELAELETRLGRKLCPSYRALLQVSNGFARFGEFVGRLLPSTETDWYGKRNPEIRRNIEEWLGAGNPLKPPYAEHESWRVDIPLRSIEITEDVEACALLLHPDSANAEREWEVWLRFIGGEDRYETLPDYMEATLATLGEEPTSAFGKIVF